MVGTLGSKLRLLRHNYGLSLRDLESKINNRVTAQAISKYEREEAVPSPEVLYFLAEALNVSVSALTSGGDIDFHRVDFRTKQPISKHDEMLIRVHVMSRLKQYLALERALELPTAAADLPREAPWPVFRDVTEAEHAAVRLRSHWGLGVEPIASLADLLEERGIKVLEIEMSDIDGLAACVHEENGNDVLVVVFNSSDFGERQRFTLAHELGHMVLQLRPKINEEKAAHRFASAFLMPAETLRARIGTHRKNVSLGELLDLKLIFGVSIQALTYRCKDLGIFDPPLFKYLFDEFSDCGWRSPPYKEPGEVQQEHPKRFERLCFRALAESMISSTYAAKLLDISIDELHYSMNSPKQ